MTDSKTAAPPEKPEAPPHADARLIPGGMKWAGSARTRFGMGAIRKASLPSMGQRPGQTDFADTPTVPSPRPAPPR